MLVAGWGTCVPLHSPQGWGIKLQAFRLFREHTKMVKGTEPYCPILNTVSECHQHLGMNTCTQPSGPPLHGPRGLVPPLGVNACIFPGSPSGVVTHFPGPLLRQDESPASRGPESPVLRGLEQATAA
jgi:hypothetical protein